MTPTEHADLTSLIAPVSDVDPCGPDLEAEDDDDYVNFTSATEVVLPTDFTVADHKGELLPFYHHPDFKELDLPGRIGSARRFCGRTHDLRLLVLLARLYILNRSAGAFQSVVEAMAVLLETAWDDVHPRSEAGHDGGRAGAIERLDEPLMIAALNNAVLFTSKRYGALTWQLYMTAVRKASGDPAGSETSAVDRVLADECSANPELLTAIRTTSERLLQALERICAAFAAHGESGVPNLVRISGAAAKLRAFFERIQPTGDLPATAGGSNEEFALSATAPNEAQAPWNAPGRIGTARRAAAALNVATHYLSDAEPSSPALLLLRQAQALVGKPFLDAMRALFPEQVKHVGVTVAASAIFRLPLTQLAENAALAEDHADADAAVAEAEDESILVPLSRADALSLLDAAASYYRAAEPSSPIPMLLDRARPLLGQDFMALVRSMLPARVLSDE